MKHNKLNIDFKLFMNSKVKTMANSWFKVEKRFEGFKF